MDLASKLAQAGPAPRVTKKGPQPACEIYGPGDVELAKVIEQRLSTGETWVQIQRLLDSIQGIEKPIHNDKFRYHFTMKCRHWDDQ